MTKKDYIIIAAVIKSVDSNAIETAADVRAEVARKLADALADDNDRFNRVTFLRACEVAP